MSIQNRLVVNRAIAGQDAEGHGAVSTRSTPQGIDHGGYRVGHLPYALRAIMHARRDTIVQVIYSYDTPIAWLDAGLWIIPDVSYSITTSKHQGFLYPLQAQRRIPWDTPLDEYMRVLNGQMYYAGGRTYGTGR